MNLTLEQTAKLVVVIAVIICAIIWHLSHFHWLSKKDEHGSRCRRCFEELKRKIRKTKYQSECIFLEEQIDDFYQEYLNLVEFRMIRKLTSELHAHLLNKQMELEHAVVI